MEKYALMMEQKNTFKISVSRVSNRMETFRGICGTRLGGVP
jgi:hypothetical protein